jgi:hypothetical protein
MTLEADDERLASLRFSQDGDIKFLIRVIDTLNRNIDAYERNCTGRHGSQMPCSEADAL